MFFFPAVGVWESPKMLPLKSITKSHPRLLKSALYDRHLKQQQHHLITGFLKGPPKKKTLSYDVSSCWIKSPNTFTVIYSQEKQVSCKHGCFITSFCLKEDLAVFLLFGRSINQLIIFSSNVSVKELSFCLHTS